MLKITKSHEKQQNKVNYVLFCAISAHKTFSLVRASITGFNENARNKRFLAFRCDYPGIFCRF